MRFTSALLATLIGAAAGPACAESSLYFPPKDGDWARITSAEAGWDGAALDAALEFAGNAKSSGVVVLLGGRILAERYWTVTGSDRYDRVHTGDTADGRALEDVASAQKSVVAFLAGFAERKQQLDLDAPVARYLGEGWSKAPRDAEAKITVRHLMSMTSGLDDALAYQHPAGTVWRYNTGAYSRMIGILEKATGTDIGTLTREKLTAPAGMRETAWAARPWSRGNDAANSIGLVTSARDLARFGLLILNRGKWRDNDLLKNPALFDAMLAPSQEMNPSYGLLWWLNGQSRVVAGTQGRGRDGSMIRTAPDDLVAAQGALGRKCYIVPSMGMVVTRLGDEPGETFNEEFWALLMKAAPAKPRS